MQQPSNVTKKELIDQVMQRTGYKRPVVRQVVQDLFETLIDELAAGRRIELRDFGVFEVKVRAARLAQNPKTLQKVEVPRKQCVKFKPGRLMKERIENGPFEVSESKTALRSSAPGSAGGTAGGAPDKPDGDEDVPQPTVKVPESFRSRVR